MAPLIWAVIICVVGQIVYHSLLKGMPHDVAPYAVIAIAYFVGFVTMTVVGSSLGVHWHTNSLTMAVVLRAMGLGVAISLIEVGYLYAYRYGLPLSSGPVTVLALTTIALFPLGIMFGDHLNAKVILGVLMIIMGLILARSGAHG